MIIGPDGKVISSAVKDESIVVGEIDLEEQIYWKQIHDITGAYNRFDIFQLYVNRKNNKPIILLDGSKRSLAERYVLHHVMGSRESAPNDDIAGTTA